MFILPQKPFPVIQQFLNENKLVVYKYIIKQIKYGIRENLQKVELFEITPTNSYQRHIAVVKYESYETVLRDAMNYAIREEDYETAAKARDILQLLNDKNINQLLNDTKPQE